jgi:hypothetical protein
MLHGSIDRPPLRLFARICFIIIIIIIIIIIDRKDEHSNGNRVELTLVELRAVIRMYGWLVAQRDDDAQAPTSNGWQSGSTIFQSSFRCFGSLPNERSWPVESKRRNNRRVRCLCCNLS